MLGIPVRSMTNLKLIPAYNHNGKYSCNNNYYYIPPRGNNYYLVCLATSSYQIRFENHARDKLIQVEIYQATVNYTKIYEIDMFMC